MAKRQNWTEIYYLGRSPLLLLFNDAPSSPWKIVHAFQPMASWQVYLKTSRWPLLDKVSGGPHPQEVDPTPFFVSLCNPTTALRLLSCGLSCLLCLGLCRCCHQDALQEWENSLNYNRDISHHFEVELRLHHLKVESLLFGDLLDFELHVWDNLVMQFVGEMRFWCFGDDSGCSTQQNGLFFMLRGWWGGDTLLCGELVASPGTKWGSFSWISLRRASMQSDFWPALFFFCVDQRMSWSDECRGASCVRCCVKRSMWEEALQFWRGN